MRSPIDTNQLLLGRSNQAIDKPKGLNYAVDMPKARVLQYNNQTLQRPEVLICSDDSELRVEKNS